MSYVKSYCGKENKDLDYFKLWKLLEDDIQKKEEEVKFQVEKEFQAENASAQKPPVDSKPSTEPKKPLEAGLSETQKNSLRNQILIFYNNSGKQNEALIDHLIPRGNSDIDVVKLTKKVKEEMKEPEENLIKEFFKSGSNQRSSITKVELKNLLFEENTKQKNLAVLKFSEQLDLVFNSIDIEKKGAIDSKLLMKGLKNLGINRTPAEVEASFNHYKKSSAAFMDKEDFARMISHEHANEISQRGAAHDKLTKLIDTVDCYRTGQLNHNQVK